MIVLESVFCFCKNSASSSSLSFVSVCSPIPGIDWQRHCSVRLVQRVSLTLVHFLPHTTVFFCFFSASLPRQTSRS